ncbi:MAG: hypothetical protein DWG76_04305 [Chloroflexi bacterium]|nr:HEAT repeat domain-containing protein [Chloroflexota bacterium]MQC26659.1 hypothetical protein [Chloroflexota bacterium]
MSDSPEDIGQDSSFDEVLEALGDESIPFPARHLYQLSVLGPNQINEFSAVFAQLSPQRRLGILQDLEIIGEANTVTNFDAISRIALFDDDAEVRVVAIRSLWQSENNNLIPEFLSLLDEDPSLKVRAQAASALGRFVFLGELGRVSAENLELLLKRLLALMDEDVDALIRRRALESLGYSGRESVAARILDSYEFGDEDWQASALFAMGRSVDDRWAPQVIERLDDINPDLSKEAARAAGELELEVAVPALLDLLQSNDSSIRLAAAWSLSQIGGSEVGEALEELLEHTGDEDEIDILEDALENLAFKDELGLNLLAFSEDDLDDLANPESSGENGIEPL